MRKRLFCLTLIFSMLLSTFSTNAVSFAAEEPDASITAASDSYTYYKSFFDEQCDAANWDWFWHMLDAGMRENLSSEEYEQLLAYVKAGAAEWRDFDAEAQADAAEAELPVVRRSKARSYDGATGSENPQAGGYYATKSGSWFSDTLDMPSIGRSGHGFAYHYLDDKPAFLLDIGLEAHRGDVYARTDQSVEPYVARAVNYYESRYGTAQPGNDLSSGSGHVYLACQIYIWAEGNKDVAAQALCESILELRFTYTKAQLQSAKNREGGNYFAWMVKTINDNMGSTALTNGISSLFNSIAAASTGGVYTFYCDSLTSRLATKYAGTYSEEVPSPNPTPGPDVPVVGSIEIRKSSSDPDASDHNGEYSLERAIFVASGAGGSYQLITDGNGYARLDSVPVGTYTLAEQDASRGYKIAPSQVVTVTAGNVSSVAVAEEPWRVEATANKVLSPDYKAIALGNPNYSLQGAVFDFVHSDTRHKWRVTSDEKALMAQGGVPLGDLDLIEQHAPKGYALNTASTRIHMVIGGTHVSINEVPQYNPMNLALRKYDEYNGATPQGDASLAGAVFTFEYYYETNMTPAQVRSGEYTPAVTFDATTRMIGGEATIKLDTKSGCVDTDTFRADNGCEYTEYLDRNGNFRFPIGTLVIREKSAPEGYLTTDYTMEKWNPQTDNTYDEVSYGFYIQCINEVDNTTNAALTFLYPLHVSERSVMRGTVNVKKVDHQNVTTTPQGDAVLNATFEIVNKSINNVWVDTNNDGTMECYAPNARIMTITTDADTKIATSGKCLPYGTYLVREISTSDNYTVVPWERTFTIRSDGQVQDFATNGADVKDGGVTYAGGQSENRTSQFDYAAQMASAANLVKRGGVSITKFSNEFFGNDPVRPEGDATLAGAKFEVVNRSAQAVYDPVTGQKYLPGEVVCTITTNEQGVATTGAYWLPIGSYSVSEVVPPEGYLLNRDWAKNFAITERGQVIMYDDLTQTEENDVNDTQAVGEDVIRGGIRIYKSDNDRIMTKPNGDEGLGQGDAHLNGAVFNVVNSSKWPVVVNGVEYKPGVLCLQLTTNEDGIAESGLYDLPYGTYTVYEATPPVGYHNDNVWTATVQVRQHGIIHTVNTYESNPLKEKVWRSGFVFQKLDGETDLNVPQGDATLAGATFDIYNDSDFAVYVAGGWHENGEVCYTFTTGEDGMFTSEEELLPYGSYHIVERAPSVGYLNNDAYRRDFKVTEAGRMYDLTDTPCEEQVIRGDVQVTKQDLELGKSEAIGGKNHGNNEFGSDLNGIVYEIRNASKQHVMVDGKLYDPGEVVTQIVTHWNEGKQAYTAETTGKALPYGTYEIREVATNNYYVLTDTDVRTVVIREDGVTVTTDTAGSDLIWKNQVIRGDIEFRKIADYSHERMSTLWSLTNMTTGEVHLVATDENGEFYSSTPNGFDHSINTNVNDKLLAKVNAGEIISMSEVDTHSGIWFGLGEHGSMAAVNDAVGALPYGRYRLQELRTDSNEGFGLQQVDFFIYRHGYVVDIGTITDYEPVLLATEAKDDTTGLQMGLAGETVTILDEVSYEGLNKGQTYTMKGTLMDKETKSPIYVTDSSGNTVPVTVEKTFTASVAGVVEMEFVLPGSVAEGKTIVVFEELFTNGIKDMEHKDINDAKQTVSYPAISTTAINNETQNHDAPSVGEVTITDTVAYRNLIAGTSYTLKGVLMDKTTGDEIVDANGNEITARQTFIADDSEGTVPMTFTFNGADVAGKTVVVFETLEYQNTRVGVHADLEDAKQTVWFPEMDTEAVFERTQNNEGVTAPNAVIEDVVTYRNLVAGSTYVLTGTVIDKATGEVLTDAAGKAVTETMTFAPVKADGTITMRFVFDASNLAGKDVVVFESLTHNGVEVAAHKDEKAENQTIHFAKIDTKAHYVGVSNNCADEGLASSDVVIRDTVTYENLRAGEEYTVVGALMDKVSGTPFVDGEGNAITAQAVFTPREANGTIDVEFRFDATNYAGFTAVVFEELMRNDIVVTDHQDLTANDQMVKFPKITTLLFDAETKLDEVAGGKTVTLTDTVTYRNLTPGRTYVVAGTLYDKATGRPLEGVECSRVTFTPETADGTQDVTFTFDTTGLEGKTLVVYEEVYRKENAACCDESTLVAAERSLENKLQTVTIPKITTNAVNPVTGDHEGIVDTVARITDTVSYENLVVGRAYMLSGKLYDKATGEAFVDADGNEVTASAGFVPEEANGTVDVEFTFNAADLGNRDVVVYEVLTQDEVQLGQHEDINDENQTVHYPEVLTKAAYGESDTNEGLADKEVTITDVVTYHNLQAGEEYVLTGMLMDKATGKPVMQAVSDEADAPEETQPEESTSSEETIPEESSAADETTPEETTEATGEPEAQVADENEASKESESESVQESESSSEDATESSESESESESEVDDEKPETEEKLVPVTATMTFVPEEKDGTVTMTFTFDASAMAGETVVVFESLVRKEIEVAIHKDLAEEEQSVYFPMISTALSETETGLSLAEPKAELSLTDTVSYANVHAGEEYVVTGTLMNPETGEAVLGADEKPVTASAAFTPESTSGTVDVVFAFDASKLAGQSVVAFESMSHNGVVVAKHEDKNDERQTVRFPEIATTLHRTGAERTDKALYVANNVSLTDVVSYQNLIPGNTYKLVGTLLTADGKPVTDKSGNAVTSMAVFTPEKEDGETEVVFLFDGAMYGGQTLVAFEKLYAVTNMETEDGEAVSVDTLLRAHEDLADASQQVTFAKPGITTVATGKRTGGDMLEKSSSTTVLDVVTYENLNPGTTYQLRGTAVDASTGKALKNDKNEDIVFSTNFIPEKPTGTVNAEFVVNAEALAGKNVVIFEKVFLGDVEIAAHEDAKDEAQTVHVMSMDTVATGSDGRSKEIAMERNVTVVDTIAYANLVPGVEYKIHGEVINKETGKAVATADAKFKPDKADGSVEVKFTVDTSSLEGKSLVCYEYVYDGSGHLLGSHADANDADQTVIVKTITKVETGVQNASGMAAGIAAGLLLLAGAAVIVVRKRRKMLP